MKTSHTSLISIACCALFAATGCKRKQPDNVTIVPPGTAERPEMVTSGIGAKFTVPAGQVAIFEVVTRRNGTTVALPPLAAYVLAQPREAVTGTFRFFPESEMTGPEVRRRAWRIELKSGAGDTFLGDLRLPDALEPTVGRLLLNLDLDQGKEVIHWNRQNDDKLPDDGLIGLRVTLSAHGRKDGGSGVGHTDWKKSSTTNQP